VTGAGTVTVSLALLCALGACDPTFEVTGRVTVNGKPPPEGTRIMARCQERTVSHVARATGEFNLLGFFCPEWPCTVAVTLPGGKSQILKPANQRCVETQLMCRCYRIDVGLVEITDPPAK
jgi:hypothetical protein